MVGSGAFKPHPLDYGEVFLVQLAPELFRKEKVARGEPPVAIVVPRLAGALGTLGVGILSDPV